MSEIKLNDDDIVNTDEGLVFSPYNPNNKEIRLNDVQSILRAYGLPGDVNNFNLYKRAFVHRSYTKRPALENKEHNIIIEKCPPDA